MKTYAYIDGTNLYKGITELGWKLDYKRFRIFLKDKYDVEKAYLFLGYIEENKPLYDDLKRWGYTLVFKPTIIGNKGEIKVNCDGELILQATTDHYENSYEAAVVITGDGDFACLVEFLKKHKKLRQVISPEHAKASILLKRAAPNHILFLERFKNKLERKSGEEK